MHFTTEIPKEVVPSWPIIVTKGKEPLRFVILSESYVGLFVHWFGGHSIECDRTPECRACRAGCRKDWKGYIAARSTENNNQAIVSVTSTVALQLVEYQRPRTGMAGLLVTTHRLPARDTGMLHATTHGWRPVSHPFPNAALEDMLGRIFAKNAGV